MLLLKPKDKILHFLGKIKIFFKKIKIFFLNIVLIIFNKDKHLTRECETTKP